jgi:hypothetical protein
MPDEPRERCDECKHLSDDLAPLGDLQLCPRCFRLAIEDMPALNMPREVINTRDVWED